MTQIRYQSKQPQYMRVSELSPSNMSLKDSHTTEYGGSVLTACTDMDKANRGITILRNWKFEERLLPGAFAPCWHTIGSDLYLLYCRGQQIHFIKYYGDRTSCKIKGLPKEVIDPEVVRYGKEYHLFFTNVTREKFKGNEICVAVSEDPEHFPSWQEVGGVQERYNVEEATRYWPDDGYMYFSVNDSHEGSTIRRMRMVMKDGIISAIEDQDFILGACGPEGRYKTFTHPDFWGHRRLGSVLKDDRWRVVEVV